MKQTTRLLALLLSVLMVVGMMPAMAAEAEYTLYDVFIAETAPSVNGEATEGIWLIEHALPVRSAEDAPTAEAGFLWDADNLYVAIRHSGAETVSVSVGQGTAIYNVADDTFTANTLSAAAAADGSVVELAIPFAAIGVSLTKFGQALPIALCVVNANGTAALAENAALSLQGEAMFMADDCGDKAAIGYEGGTTYGDPSKVTITQEDGAYRFHATAALTNTNGIRRSQSVPNEAMTIEFEVTLNELSVYSGAYPWRGFIFDLRTDHYLRRCSINKGSDGIVYFNMLIAAGQDDGVRAATTLKEGDRAVFRLEVLEDQTTELYIDDAYVYTFPAQQYRATSTMNPNSILEWSICQYNWVSGETDVLLHNYHITRPVYADDAAVAAAMLDELTFDDIKGGNSNEDMVLADLDLPEALEVPVLGSEAPLTWESSNTALIAHDGTFVSEGEGGEVILTATLTYNGKTYTKEFVLNVPAFDPNAKAMYLENDRNPYTGVLGSMGMSVEVTLDQNLTSVGYDLGGMCTVNEILLNDTDSLSRIHKDNLSLYVSDDNVTYRRVKDWTLFRSNINLFLTNFEEECRYVKIHCNLEDTDGAAFTNNLQDMIRPQYNESLIGHNGGEFTLLRKVQVSAEEGYTDAIAQIKQDSEYDLRFVCDGKLLQHYFDGETWFVRVPEIEDTAIVEIWGGNEIAADLSNLEGVFEAVYGNRTVQDMTDPYYYGNIKARQMPNGDLIAIFNRPTNPCDLMYRRSTDGGRTWSDAEVLTDTLDTGRNEGGSYLVDGDRVWFCYFFYTRFSQNNMAIPTVRSL